MSPRSLLSVICLATLKLFSPVHRIRSYIHSKTLTEEPSGQLVQRPILGDVWGNIDRNLSFLREKTPRLYVLSLSYKHCSTVLKDTYIQTQHVTDPLFGTHVEFTNQVSIAEVFGEN